MKYAFQSLFMSQLLSDAGDQIVLIAISWTLAQGYGGGFLGLVLAIWAITRGFLLMMGGVVADRYNRRTISLLTGLVLTASILGVAGLGASTTGPFRWIWLTLAVLLGVLDGIRIPIAGSLVPFVVERTNLIHANRWMQLREWGTASIGPALGGGLMAWSGGRGALLIAGLVYMVSAIAILGIPSMPSVQRVAQSSWLDLREGLLYVVHNDRLHVLLPTFALANLFVLGVFSVGIVLFAHTILRAGPLGLGLLAGSFSVGMAIGVILVPYVPQVFHHSLLHLFGLFVLSDVMLALVGLTHSLISAVIVYGMSGLLAGPPATFYRTWLQVVPPPEFLGRVSSIARAISFGLEPASAAIVGAASRVITTNVLILIAGGCATLIDVSGMFRSRSGRSAKTLHAPTDHRPE